MKEPVEERYVQKIYIHEKYNGVTEGNDIALLRITPPVDCGGFIGPGCLPHFKAGPPKVPQTCYVTGWGYMNEKGEYVWGSLVGANAHPWSFCGRDHILMCGQVISVLMAS